MRLKSLELIGFKSFVDRTVISFEGGITSIVGPNGSGKSNVVDSIRWVMGEQSARHLRGTDMSDVIFNGSEVRPATGMASVFLTFDNSDGRAPAEYASYSEITIGRRLYRSGESEYYINKVPCRLKDVVEFFLGTGVGTKAYSIVEQGQVERIVSAKPEERRQLLEEAAGISKFKMHRDAALRKIEATKQNLARLADIISELEHQKNSLSRQARKAERYKEIADELRVLELSLAAHQYRKWNEELAILKDRLSKLTEEEAVKGASVSSEETVIDATRIALTESERKLNSMQEKHYEFQNKLKLNEAEVKFKTDQLANLGVRCEETSAEISELKIKRAEKEENLNLVNQAKVNADVELASIEEIVGTIQKKVLELQTSANQINEHIESSRKEVLECIRVVSETKAWVEQIEKQDIDISGKIARDQTEIDAIDKKIASIEADVLGAQTALTDMKGVKESINVELASLGSDTEKIKSELLHNEADLSSLNQRLSVKRSRLVSLEEIGANFEGYNEGVRAILKKRVEAPEVSGIFGTISEMLETEPMYETAVSAVLGEKLQYVVVKSHSEGVEAIDYLKTASAGRSTFVPLEIREEVSASAVPSGEGVIGPMLGLVKFSAEYKQVGRYLFNDIILVEDLNKALKVWQSNGFRKTLVTLDGEVVDPYGVVSGGSGGAISRQFLANKREVAELKVEVERLTQEVASRGKLLTDLRNRVQVNEARISQLKASFHSHDVSVVHKDRDIIGLNQQLDNWRKNRDRLTVETAALSEERESASIEKIKLTEKIETTLACQHEHDGKVDRMISDTENLRNELNVVSEELTAKKVQLASSQEQSLSLDKEYKMLNVAITEIDSGISAKMADISEWNQQIERDKKTLSDVQNEIGGLVREIESINAIQTEVKQAYDKMVEELRAKELAMRELRRSFEEVKNALYELKLDEAKSAEKVFYLEREIQEKYHVDLVSRHQDFSVESVDAEGLEKMSTKVSELKEKIEKIGAVNTDAISEYEGIAQRYEFLSKQSEDLKVSLETLQRAIVRINRTSKERFVETFNAVNDRFKALFPRLFHGGGKAELILVDQENVLESGIEIFAQPPGKKLQGVSLLSGGEKALVATTFIFSIFLIKPSPFCLLDEVDAPLDDANIDRFNQLVREMSKISQFIMITHNRRTMELADTLYGVTMEEPGCSKVVSVRLEKVL